MLQVIKRKNEELVEEARSALQFAKQLAMQPKEKTKEDVFAEFVASELKQIKEPNIYNEVKWNIQRALMDGIRKYLLFSTRPSIIVPSTSSSDSNLSSEPLSFTNYQEDSV